MSNRPDWLIEVVSGEKIGCTLTVSATGAGAVPGLKRLRASWVGSGLPNTAGNAGGAVRDTAWGRVWGRDLGRDCRRGW